MSGPHEAATLFGPPAPRRPTGRGIGLSRRTTGKHQLCNRGVGKEAGMLTNRRGWLAANNWPGYDVEIHDGYDEVTEAIRALYRTGRGA